MYSGVTNSTAACTRTCMIVLCGLIVGGCICGVVWSTHYHATHPVQLISSGSSRVKFNVPDYVDTNHLVCCSLKSIAAVDEHQKLKSNCTIIPYKRYMLAFHYAEQLTRASVHYQTFLNLAFQMNMTGVEPLIHNSRLYGVRDPKSTSENWIAYHNIFNVSAMKQGLKHCLLDGTGTNVSESLNEYRDVLESSPAFFKFSYQKIILVYIVADHGVRPSSSFGTPSKIWRSRNRSIMKAHPKFGNSTTIVDCTRETRLNGIAAQAEDLLNLERCNQLWCGTQCQKFTVIQSFCISNSDSVILTPNTLKSTLLKFQYTHKTSIVFWHWQGSRTVESFRNPAAKFGALQRCRVFPLPHSGQVKDAAAKMLLASKLHNTKFVSVHIRLERLFEFEGFSNRTACCMERLKKLITLVKNRHNLTHALVITDYSSNDGSDSCRYGGKGNEKHEICETAGRKALALLVDRNESSVVQASTTNYNGGLHHSGFVSRVEAESLMAGQVLITVGTGSFQNSLTLSFLQNQSKTSPLHYHLCLGVEYLNGLEEQLADATCQNQVM